MNQVIKNPQGETLNYSFAKGISSSYKGKWLVIIGHGVTANKDRPLIVDTAAALNEADFDTLRFSYSGNGNSEGDFRDATISKEANDLAAVIDSIAPTYTKVVYIGHSMGGAVGVLQCSKDSRINALISLAGMVNARTFAETEFSGEVHEKSIMWDLEECPLSKEYIHDLCHTINSLAPFAERITIPWLLLHGTADDVIPRTDTEQIQSIKRERVQVSIIEGADHRFDEPSHRTQVTSTVVAWLCEQIKAL